MVDLKLERLTNKETLRSDKLKNLLEQIQVCIEKGNYRFSNHALERKYQRAFTLPDILYILKNGQHEKIKDVWDSQYKTWKYAIRGRTVDKDEGRIIVTVEKSGMLIITVIRLNKKVLK